MFVWQFPHFLSIAWLYREDYAQGDIRMLPVVDSNGKSTVWRILAYSAALIPVSVLPVALGMAGRVYFVGAILMGAMLFQNVDGDGNVHNCLPRRLPPNRMPGAFFRRRSYICPPCLR